MEGKSFSKEKLKEVWGELRSRVWVSVFQGRPPTLQHQGRDTCDSSKETVPHSLSSKESGKMANIAVVTCLLQVLLHYLIVSIMYCHQEKQHIFKRKKENKEGR